MLSNQRQKGEQMAISKNGSSHRVDVYNRKNKKRYRVGQWKDIVVAQGIDQLCKKALGGTVESFEQFITKIKAMKEGGTPLSTGVPPIKKPQGDKKVTQEPIKKQIGRSWNDITVEPFVLSKMPNLF
jgi:hypothetical protein